MDIMTISEPTLVPVGIKIFLRSVFNYFSHLSMETDDVIHDIFFNAI